MIIETQILKTIRNYADLKKLSVQAIYKQIKNEKITTIDIDGVTFVVMMDEAKIAQKLSKGLQIVKKAVSGLTSGEIQEMVNNNKK